MKSKVPTVLATLLAAICLTCIQTGQAAVPASANPQGASANLRALETVTTVELSTLNESVNCSSTKTNDTLGSHGEFKLETESALLGLLMAAQQSGLEVEMAVETVTKSHNQYSTCLIF